MAKKRTREVILENSQGVFSILKKPGTTKETYDFSSLLALRQVLNNEKARIIHVIKHHNPSSIYHLAKILNRSFKGVRDDVKLLERFGFIELVEERDKNRLRHKPIVAVDSLTINFLI